MSTTTNGDHDDHDHDPVQPRSVHLVGSIPLPDTTSVFTRMSQTLGNRLSRIPDGETGERYYFVVWQRAVFADCPWVLNSLPLPGIQDKPWTGPVGATVLKPTQFDDAAIASYAEFVRLRKEGVIEKGVRFLVALPTPINTIACHVLEAYALEAEKLYEEQLLNTLRLIQDHIPKEDLAIQWDVAIEFAMLEGIPLFKPWFAPVLEGITERLTRLGGLVDEGVQMGFHLCYGDIAHQHFTEPKDSGKLVEVANLILENVKREVNWIHLPVPKNRTDPEFYAPMKQMKLRPETELFLGLAHADDVEGTRERIKLANDVVDTHFGIATECGMGRTPLDEFESVMNVLSVVR